MEFNENINIDETDYDIKVSGELNEAKPFETTGIKNDPNQIDELTLEDLLFEDFGDETSFELPQADEENVVTLEDIIVEDFDDVQADFDSEQSKGMSK